MRVGDDHAIAVRVRYKPPLADKARELERLIDAPLLAAETPSEDWRLATAAAGFAMLLRESLYMPNFGWPELIELARPAAGRHPRRLELVTLIEQARLLSEQR